MSEMVLVFIVLGGTIVLFISDRIRLDVVALMSLLVLMLTGLVTTTEALAGFSASIVLTIAGLFVVGAGLVHTGVADVLGRWMAHRAGTSEVRILVLVMAIVAILSAFMSSTGAVAVLLPVVVSLARDAKVSPSKLLMPLAFGSLIGGMITLIGTPPNLVVSAQLQEMGYGPFAFFDFTPIGLIMLLVGTLFMLFVGRHLLPDRAARGLSFRRGNGTESLTLAELAETYHLSENLFRLRIRRGSPLVGQTCGSARLGELYHVNVLEIQSWPEGASLPSPVRQVSGDTVLNEHDILHVQGPLQAISRLCREQDLGVRPQAEAGGRLMCSELGLAEVLLTPRSRLDGRTLQDVRFRSRYGVSVLALMRMGEQVEGNIAEVPLRFGDTLLVEGIWQNIESLKQEHEDFIVVGQPRELTERFHSRRQAAIALTIMVTMLVVMTLEIVPAVTAVLLAAVAMVLSGSVRPQDFYASINWESVVLIAAMLPMSTALEKSGGVQFVADTLTHNLGTYGPLAIMAGLFLITAFFSQFISNTATTVLVAPIAAQTALELGIDPHAFLMAVALSASTAFATPIASPVNTLVLGPGGYRFSDFARIGIPLQVVVLVLVMVLVPVFFPM